MRGILERVKYFVIATARDKQLISMPACGIDNRKLSGS